MGFYSKNGGLIGPGTISAKLGVFDIIASQIIGDGLFGFSSATFRSPITAGSYTTSSAQATNCFGPTQAELQTHYNSNDINLANLLTQNTYFKVPYNGYQWFVIPSSGNYQITAQGATGGSTSATGRAGCKLQATFALNINDVIWMAIGQAGSSGNAGSSDWCSAGGGGATFVAKATNGISSTLLSSVSACLLCAAGGQGSQEARFSPSTPAASSSANGTGGSAYTSLFLSNSINGLSGGYGGYYGYGGFGGGAASDDGTGPAGGYDGLYSIAPNSFVNASGTNVTRTDIGDYIWPGSGYVTIAKV